VGEVKYEESTGRMLELSSNKTKSTKLDDSLETDF
jgi:hypothetical protein